MNSISNKKKRDPGEPPRKDARARRVAFLLESSTCRGCSPCAIQVTRGAVVLYSAGARGRSQGVLGFTQCHIFKCDVETLSRYMLNRLRR